MNYSKGKWTTDGYQIVIPKKVGFKPKPERPIFVVAQCGTYTSANRDNGEVKANANLIVSAVNACISINPDNPQAVAEAIGDMYEALKEAKLQIEYLHEKFKETGTGNAVLTRIQIALNKAEGK